MHNKLSEKAKQQFGMLNKQQNKKKMRMNMRRAWFNNNI